MASTQEQSPDFLLGHTLTLGLQGRYRLEKVLGGGATAVVFLGVNPEALEDTSRHVAVKVARAEERWHQALAREWRNLRTLAEAEQRKGTHYFPRVLFPANESDLRQDVYLEGGWITFLVLVQELVTGIGVHDLLLDYPPDLRLPEPLALEIARQYAEMLAILHDAGLTCADRKLADLRWEKTYDFKPGDRESLARWRVDSPGRLMVLDWNVTEQASRGPHGTIALDLFRFGIIWHRMLLGVEPRFRRGAGWQLEEPLEKNPIWPQLSFGTRQILSRLLHPVPERRYLDAPDLLGDVERQVHLWQAESQALEKGFKSVYDNIASLGFVGRHEVEEALRAADVLRLRVEECGERKPTDFDNVHRALWRAMVEAPFRPMREALYKSQWDKALDEIKNLEEEYIYDPAQRLHLSRLGQITALAYQTRRYWEEIKPLYERSELMLKFDRPADVQVEQELDDKKVDSWRKEAEDEQEDGWKTVKVRLWQEAGYRLALAKARLLKEQGGVQEALTLFSGTLSLRELLAEQGTQILTWLDQLYGDPTPEQEEVENIVRAGQNRAASFEKGLQAIFSGDIVQDATAQLAAAIRADPGNQFLIRTYHLLEVEQAYRRAEEARSLLLEIYRLGQLRRAWKDLLKVGLAASGDVENGFTALGRILAKYEPQIEVLLADRQKDIRLQVLPPFGDSSNDFRVVLLLSEYLAAFGGDKEFVSALREFLDDVQGQIARFQEEKPSPETIDEYERRASEYIKQACLGEKIMKKILRESWPERYTDSALRAHLDQEKQEAREQRVRRVQKDYTRAALISDYMMAP